MRKLTFAGFLDDYLRELSLGKHGGVRRWAAEAALQNPRLREPLVLYAILTGKQQLLLDCLSKLGELPAWVSPVQENSQALTEHQLFSLPLPYEYTKVYKAYDYRSNRICDDNHTKQLIRNRIIELQRQQHISNYRIYTSLGLNHGNVNRYLKHGDCSKVSLATARMALQYVEQTQ